MEFTLNQISDSVKEIEIKLSFDEIKDELNKEVKKRTQKLQIDGFRKGKVPQHIIKKMFGDAMEYEASEKIANNFFWYIVEKEKIRVLDKPVMTKLDFKNGEKLDFKIKFETIPALDVKDYTNIEIELPDYQATDHEVEHEIEHILESDRQFEIVEQVGDGSNFVLETEIIRTGTDGNILENVKPERITIDLSKSTVHPDIIENSKSKKVGESFQFHFIDEKRKDTSDEQPIEIEDFYYKVKILGIKKIVTPELNEELIKKITKDRISNVDDFKKDIKENLQKFYDQKFDELMKLKLMSEIVKRNDFTPPKVMVDSLAEQYLKNEEEFYKKNKMFFNREETSQRILKNAENEVKWYLIRDEIIKKENITVTDEELEEDAKKESEQTGLPIEKHVNYYKSSNVFDSLLEKKLFNFLVVNNRINKVSPDNFNKKEETNES